MYLQHLSKTKRKLKHDFFHERNIQTGDTLATVIGDKKKLPENVVKQCFTKTNNL